jgi:hypothetical protein
MAVQRLQTVSCIVQKNMLGNLASTFKTQFHYQNVSSLNTGTHIFIDSLTPNILRPRLFIRILCKFLVKPYE